MSPGPAGNLADLLDAVQSLGEAPTVNPARTPWTPPATRPPAWPVWGLLSFLAVLGMILFWVVTPNAAVTYIYVGF